MLMPMTPELVFPARHFMPLRHDRVQRFTVGDTVVVAHGPSLKHGEISPPYVVAEVSADAHPKEFAHCSGRSARYTLTNYPGELYDWELEAYRPFVPQPGVPFCVWVFLAVTLVAVMLLLKFMFFL